MGCPDARSENSFVPALAALTKTLLKGNGPEELAKWFTGAPLTPLRKFDGGVRPIAVGETLRRLVAAVALKRCAPKATRLMKPHQFGVSSKNGSETVIHATRACTDQHRHNTEFALLQFDLENAFNKVCRCFLREINRHLHEIAPWDRYCYGENREPVLWCGDTQARSHARVQQGDPLGPLLFSLAFRPVLNTLQNRLHNFDVDSDEGGNVDEDAKDVDSDMMPTTTIPEQHDDVDVEPHNRQHKRLIHIVAAAW